MNKLKNKKKPLQKRSPALTSEPYKKRNPTIRSEPELMNKPLEKSIGFERDKVRQLIEIYYDVQDVRIRTFNRLRQVGQVKGVNAERLKTLEKEIRDYILHEIKYLAVYQKFLSLIKGIGPILAGGLLSYFNPYEAEHASSFWRYAGLHVVNGKAPRREHGKKISYNPKAKVLCWKISDSFIKQRTPFYRDIYDKAKNKENEKLGNPLENPENCPYYKECLQKLKKKAQKLGRERKPTPCKLHIHYRAMRKMAKRFLADFWVAWRRLEGLTVTEPYAIAILGHGLEENQRLFSFLSLSAPQSGSKLNHDIPKG